MGRFWAVGSCTLLLCLLISAGCTLGPGQAKPPEEEALPASCTGSETKSSEGFAIQSSSKGISSAPLALSQDGKLLAAVNPDSASVTLVDTQELKVLREIKVGKTPTTLTISSDGKRAYVANRGDGALSVIDLASLKLTATVPIGHQPYGVVSYGAYVFATDVAAWEVIKTEAASLKVVSRVSTEPFPTGLAITGDGKTLLVTHLHNGRVTAIDSASMAVTGTMGTGHDTNLSQFIAISADGKKAYLPQTRSNVSNQALLFDSTVFPVVNVVELSTGKLLNNERVTLDTADRPVSMPIAVEFSSDGKTLYVISSGSGDLSVIDLETLRAVAHIDIGSQPRGVMLSKDGNWLYVNSLLDGTLTVVDTRKLVKAAEVKLTDIPMPPGILRGKRLFNSSAGERLARDKWISCATCHFDGGHDARTWEAFPDGPRNTPALFGVAGTLPVHWSGDLDELQDVEITIRTIQAGKGLIDGEAYDSLGAQHAGRSQDLDTLVAFMGTLKHERSPCTLPSGGLRAAALRGKGVFDSLGCASCHTAPLYTDRRLHDVGTGAPALERNSHGRGTTFDTPSLLGIWATAPYFHDGSAVSLENVLSPSTPRRGFDPHSVGDRSTSRERTDLILFLRSLPFDENVVKNQ